MTKRNDAPRERALAPAPAHEPAASEPQASAAIQQLAADLARHETLEARVAAIRAALDGRIAFSTSLGIEDQVVLHAIATQGADIDVFTLDTGRHFHETLETVSRSEARYGLKIRLVAPEAGELEDLVDRDGVLGFRLSVDKRKSCCEVRKVRPLRKALAGAAGWITGLRRGQSSGRADVPFAEWDPAFALLKLNPIADWPLERIEAFVRDHDVPVNPLHQQGFPSIGCAPCTRAVRPGEDIRAGRWWWEADSGKECGLHAPKRREAAA